MGEGEGRYNLHSTKFYGISDAVLQTIVGLFSIRFAKYVSVYAKPLNHIVSFTYRKGEMWWARASDYTICTSITCNSTYETCVLCWRWGYRPAADWFRRPTLRAGKLNGRKKKKKETMIPAEFDRLGRIIVSNTGGGGADIRHVEGFRYLNENRPRDAWPKL